MQQSPLAATALDWMVLAAAAQTQWQDEEDLLPFSLFANELELLVGTARGKAKPDPLATLQLLQKLVATLDRTPNAEVQGGRGGWGASPGL